MSNGETTFYNRNEEEFKLILQELLDLRQDERDCQNQILQVLSVAGTFIGILFGGSFIFGGNLTKLNAHLLGNPDEFSGIMKVIATYATTLRFVFLLNSIVLCIAISYVLKIAITDVIRYFHVQELQNRANDLMKIINGGYSDLVLWDEYKMTVMTMDPKHLNNTFAAIHFMAYNVSMIFIMILCIAMTVIQYALIQDKQWYDNIGLIIVGTTSLFCLGTAIYGSTHESKAFAKALHKKVLDRRNNKKQGNEIVHNILYLFYPRLNDLQKPLLIVCGAFIAFILGKYGFHNWILWVMMHRLFWTIIIFDFFVYQARFLVNDIRGFKEDDHSKNSKRLIVNDDNKVSYIKVSIINVLVRIIIAFLLLNALHDKLRPVIQIHGHGFKALEIEVLVLLAVTIVYEAVRSFKVNWLVYILVGVGYPLRIAVGFMSAYPDIDPIKTYPLWGIVLFLVGVYFMGVFSATLAWVLDVISIKRKGGSFAKSYYEDFYKMIEDSYIIAENSGAGEEFYPLREKGNKKQIWNLAFIACFLTLSCSMLMFLTVPYKIWFIRLDVAVGIILLLVAFWFSGDWIKNGISVALSLIAIKTIMLIATTEVYKSAFVIITLFQALVIYIYYLQRYTPHMPTIGELIKLLGKTIVSFLFTEDIAEQLFPNRG